MAKEKRCPSKPSFFSLLVFGILLTMRKAAPTVPIVPNVPILVVLQSRRSVQADEEGTLESILQQQSPLALVEGIKKRTRQQAAHRAFEYIDGNL